MNGMRFAFLLGVAVAISGCASKQYSDYIRDDLKVPYVYMPPNNLGHPYTLVQSTYDGNYQTACSASQLTGLSEKEILEQRQVNYLGDVDLIRNFSASINVDVSKEDVGTLGNKYAGNKRVELRLDNGKIFTLPGVDLDDVVKRIASGKCKDNIRILLAGRPDSEFLMPLQMFSYNVQYRIYSEGGIDVTADLPKEVTKIILAKVGVGYKSASDISIAADDLYVGFRGTPIPLSLAFFPGEDSHNQQVEMTARYPKAQHETAMKDPERMSRMPIIAPKPDIVNIVTPTSRQNVYVLVKPDQAISKDELVEPVGLVDFTKLVNSIIDNK